jgi:hypothetical protein
MFFANQLDNESVNAPGITTGDFVILGKTNYIKPVSHSSSLRLIFLRVKRSAKGGTSHPNASHYITDLNGDGAALVLTRFYRCVTDHNCGRNRAPASGSLRND